MNPFRNSDADEKAPLPSAPQDLSDPADRRRAAFSYHVLDHAFLRHHWTNLAEVAPGVWRSNHPTDARFAAYKAMGIRTILNLRGAAKNPPFLFEAESCARHGLTLVSVGLYARKAPSRGHVLTLFDTFRSIELPFLMHCKSGADRAGFASALYLLSQRGATLAEARKQLSWRFLHFRWSKTGILDHILDLYGAHLAKEPLGIEDWFRDHYDPAAAMASFRR
jgi:protein tyrosine phosphatase (PTP) superfamily phosphohydrolase (DUF442 family)